MSGKARGTYNNRIRLMLPKRCVLNAGKCSLRSDGRRRDKLIKKQPYAFVVRPYTKDCLDMERACKELIEIDYYIARNATSEETAGSPKRDEMAAILAKDETFVGNGFCQICSLCLYSYFGVAELGHLNPNVLLEIGLMFAFAKPVIFTLDNRLTVIHKVPFDLNGLLLIPYLNYQELESGLKSKVSAVLEELRGKDLLRK